ncbi:hypothetical protein BG011_002532 [Mortierella polycephala]|uniref:Uncharacterized protein n=1 Tax=Mortierella polycephala TaxID=41804 RepID=A0A9P6Q6L3_9FUNG|nr:hypothetical protein BG011_002532 [Mortierella polycephala]
MALLTSIAGFTTFGVAARGLALTVQRRPIASGFGGYAISAAVFGGVGYFMHNLEQRQNELLKERMTVLTANRERRLAVQEDSA